jgi:hypothetical protein
VQGLQQGLSQREIIAGWSKTYLLTLNNNTTLRSFNFIQWLDISLKSQ